MVAYLEDNELVVGKNYQCRTYIGDIVILHYTGNGVFIFPKNTNPLPNAYDDKMYLEGDVRYVL